MNNLQNRETVTKSVNPQQQLWESTPEAYHGYLACMLGHLKKESQEDICIALVAYIRFGLRRPFGDPFMKLVFNLCIDLLELQ